ncbi:MAG: response regulator transcription factor [Candidatus Sulfotelmatobacter sp.]|jgi:DNA-binding NarL/FixJ family response regulator
MLRRNAVPIVQLHVGLIASHPLVANYIRDLLLTLDMNVTSVVLQDTDVATGMPALQAYSVILFDIHDLPLPVSSYLDEFSTSFQSSSFLALDRPRETSDIADLLLLGFSGFMSYDQVPDLLGPAITSIAKGETWVTPEVMRKYMVMTSRRSPISESGNEILTKRESQIRDLLRKRYSNKEIAMLLNICESTVKFHVSNVLAKSNATGRRDLTFHGTSSRVLPMFSRRCG